MIYKNVTGVSTGIGLSLALAFDKRGMKIVLAELDERRLKRAQRKLNKIGAEVSDLKIDVSDPIKLFLNSINHQRKDNLALSLKKNL